MNMKQESLQECHSNNELSTLRAEISSYKEKLAFLNKKLNALRGPERILHRLVSKIEQKDYKRDFVTVYMAVDGMYTNQQTCVACLLKNGLSTRAIAEKLFITEKTVKFHKTSIYALSGVKNALEFIVWMRGKIDNMPKSVNIEQFLDDPIPDTEPEQVLVNLPQSQIRPCL